MLHSFLGFTGATASALDRSLIGMRDLIDRTLAEVRLGEAGPPMKEIRQSGADRTGVGLGLTISRKAIEASGGTLSVKNLPGVGCVFTIDLPRAPARRPPPG